MSDKPAPGEHPPRRQGEEAGVLGALPATRPTRLGRQSRTTAKPKAPERAAAPAAKAPAKRPSRPGPDAGPKAVRAGAPNLGVEPLGPGEKRIVPEPEGPCPPTGTELVTTVVQAGAEVARIGLTIGGQVLRRSLGRIPRP